LTLPIVAYRGGSQLTFDRVVPINGRRTALEVRNTGDRPGFILFSGSPSSVTITPPAHILSPSDSQIFEFAFLTEPHPVSVVYGDEIVRQVRAHLRPQDILAAAFGDVRTKDELVLIKGILRGDSRSDLASLLRKNINETQVRFVWSSQVAFSPGVLEFETLMSSKSLKIANSGSRPMAIKLKAQDDFVAVSPGSALLPPNSDLNVLVSVSEEGNSVLAVMCDNDSYSIPIHFSEHSSVIVHNKKFSVSSTSIQFGEAEIGLSVCQTLEIQNKTDNKLTIELLLPKRSAFSCPSQLLLPAREIGELEIEFSPAKHQKIEELLVVRSGHDSSQIVLTGEGVLTGDRDDQIVSQGDLVAFPECETGSLRRARVRVVNRTKKVNEIRAAAKPPFFCPVTQFTIDPQSFVLFPIHFAPQKKGRYDGIVEFVTTTGKKTLVELRGICQ
jgi:hypothetical protein